MTHLISCLTFLVFGVLVMQVAGVTKEEIERAELEATPVIPDSEVSPAAYIFQNEE